MVLGKGEKAFKDKAPVRAITTLPTPQYAEGPEGGNSTSGKLLFGYKSLH